VPPATGRWSRARAPSPTWGPTARVTRCTWPACPTTRRWAPTGWCTSTL